MVAAWRAAHREVLRQGILDKTNLDSKAHLMQSRIYSDNYYHYEDEQMVFCRLGCDVSGRRSMTITYWVQKGKSSKKKSNNNEYFIIRLTVI